MPSLASRPTRGLSAAAALVLVLTACSSGGSDGAVGPSGPSGPSGPQGVEGPAGPAGVDGLQGSEGQAGPQGIDGPQGIPGPQGTAGADGLQGLTGAPGPQGLDGPQGPSGPAGTYAPPTPSWALFAPGDPAYVHHTGSSWVLEATDAATLRVRMTGPGSVTASIVYPAGTCATQPVTMSSVSGFLNAVDQTLEATLCQAPFNAGATALVTVADFNFSPPAPTVFRCISTGNNGHLCQRSW